MGEDFAVNKIRVAEMRVPIKVVVDGMVNAAVAAFLAEFDAHDIPQMTKPSVGMG